MDRRELTAALATFDGSADERRVVARQARDMADADLPEHFDRELTVDDVLDNLDDAPEDCSLVERWNWWIGSLQLAHGGYDRFRVRQ